MATSRIADSVGRVLGDRYRLTRPLGTGASAHVYVAEDVSLRRRVAIKVLHPGLADDEGFLRRFRAEARVVAALRHPHILRVYDWGEDDGSPYLVTELLEGGSLRSFLDCGHLLTPSQATVLGFSVAGALDYAHRRGLVHRDIKPANLLFDEEGQVSVADFGLARALAEATWTEPAGAVLGTARYAPPEAVQGRVLDNRADIYSLALVLTEAVTGIVPFATDTTLGTLMARLEQSLPVPASAGPLVGILEAAGTVDPDDRLDAPGLARAFEALARTLPPPAPMPLAGPLLTGEPERDVNPTELPGRAGGTTSRRGQRPGERASVLVDRDAEVLPGGAAGPDPTVAYGAQPAADVREADVPDADVTVADRSGLAAPGAGVAAPPAVAPGSAEPTASVPEHGGSVYGASVYGASVYGASEHGASEHGASEHGASEHGAPGSAVPAVGAPTLTRPIWPAPAVAAPPAGPGPTGGSSPPALPGGNGPAPADGGRGPDDPRWAGRRWRVAAIVAVVVLLAGGGAGGAWLLASRKPPLVAVPSLAGDTRAQATSALVARHLGLAVAGRAYNAKARAGTVIGQTPTSGRLREHQTVAVTLSLGPQPVAVPKLRGLSEQVAERLLQVAGLVTGKVTTATSVGIPSGDVMSSTPDHGHDLLPGQKVDLVVSSGKPSVTVPVLSGSEVLSYASAAAALQADHLVASEQMDYSNVVPVGEVIVTVPAPGQSVLYGSTVAVEMSKGPDLVAVPNVSGETLAQAGQKLTDAGFVVTGVTGNPFGQVRRTNPPAGTKVLEGSGVLIITGGGSGG